MFLRDWKQHIEAQVYASSRVDICFEVEASAAASEDFVSTRLLRLFGGIYGLIARLCAEDAVDLHSKSMITEIRVLAMYRDRDGAQAEASEAGQLALRRLCPCGPVVPLSRLIARPRHWDSVFLPHAPPDRSFTSYFSRNWGRAFHDGGPDEWTVNLLPRADDADAEPGDELHAPETHVPKPHLVVAMGGTFDHLHLGHRLLLTAMALLGAARRDRPDAPRRLIVGITGDAMLTKKQYPEFMEPWETRHVAVARFLNAVLDVKAPFESLQPRVRAEPGPNGHAVHYAVPAAHVTIECVEISDAFGPTVTDEAVSALVVSGETSAGGKAVNDRRESMGWAPLEIVEVDVLDARSGEDGGASNDYQDKISSTAIRRKLAEEAPSSPG